MSSQALATQGIAPIRPDVFFTVPDALPRGRHNLTREQVREAQRERLLVAMTELLAARGYRALGPGEIAGRAGVSLGAFYANFENKDACVFAGYERFIEILLERMTAVDTSALRPDATVRALLGAWIETLQSDLVVARAYHVEIDALGLPARRRRRDAMALFAQYIRQLAEAKIADVDLPWTAYIGVVYAARQLVADTLDDAEEPDLHGELGGDLEVWLNDLFRAR